MTIAHLFVTIIFNHGAICFVFFPQKESEKRNVTVQADDPISFMQLTAKNEMTSKEDQFQLSLLAAMGNTQRKEAADPLASKLNKVFGRFYMDLFESVQAIFL